jgi:hypothetical protein
VILPWTKQTACADSTWLRHVLVSGVAGRRAITSDPNTWEASKQRLIHRSIPRPYGGLTKIVCAFQASVSPLCSGSRYSIRALTMLSALEHGSRPMRPPNTRRTLSMISGGVHQSSRRGFGGLCRASFMAPSFSPSPTPGRRWRPPIARSARGTSRPRAAGGGRGPGTARGACTRRSAVRRQTSPRPPCVPDRPWLVSGRAAALLRLRVPAGSRHFTAGHLLDQQCVGSAGEPQAGNTLTNHRGGQSGPQCELALRESMSFQVASKGVHVRMLAGVHRKSQEGRGCLTALFASAYSGGAWMPDTGKRTKWTART